MPPRSSDTETGSETEVKNSQTSTNNSDEPSSEPVIPPITITIASADDDDNSAHGVELENGIIVSRAEVVEPSESVVSISIEDVGRSPSPLPPSLPDAIPSHESESGSQMSLEVSKAVNISNSNNNLPDLITSSPKLSRQSSKLSLASDSEFFESTEDLSSIKDEDVSEKSLTVKIITPDPAWLEVEAVLNKPDEENDKPIVMVTSATPTTERPPDSRLIEPTKLTVPKETSPVRRESQPEIPTSFDNLLQELRQRKAKNKAEAEAEALKPLAAETAKLQVSKYFGGAKIKIKKIDDEKKVLKKQDSSKSEDDYSESKPVELRSRARVSDKIDKKDILKYFNSSSFDSKTSPVNNVEEEPYKPVEEKSVTQNGNNHMDIMNDITVNDLDMDEIEREFNEIERQNKNNLELLKSVDLSDPTSDIGVDLFETTVINNGGASSEGSIADEKDIVNRKNESSPATEDLDSVIDEEDEFDKLLDIDDAPVNDDLLEQLFEDPVEKTPKDMSPPKEILNQILVKDNSLDLISGINVKEDNSSDKIAYFPVELKDNLEPIIEIKETIVEEPLDNHLINDYKPVIDRPLERIPEIIEDSKPSTISNPIESDVPTKEVAKTSFIRSYTLPQKFKIHRVTIKEQQLLPVKIAEIKPERLTARIYTPTDTPQPASSSTNDTPKPPGRRRLEEHRKSISSPSSPIAPARNNKSDIKKSLSIRLRKHSGSESPVAKSQGSSTLPHKKNGLATQKSEVHGSFKSVDGKTREKKEKCVIS